MTDQIPDKVEPQVKDIPLIYKEDVPKIQGIDRDVHHVICDLAKTVRKHCQLTWRERGWNPFLWNFMSPKMSDIYNRARTGTFYTDNEQVKLQDMALLIVAMNESPLPKFKDLEYGMHPDSGLYYYWDPEIFDDEGPNFGPPVNSAPPMI